jgi:hypothetical protein
MSSVPVPPPDAPSGETQWALCLDAFAAQLAEGQEALRDGRVDEITPFPVPDALPPLPQALVAEAARVLAQAQQLERGLELAQEEVRRQLHVARRMHAATPARSAFLEARA